MYAQQATCVNILLELLLRVPAAGLYSTSTQPRLASVLNSVVGVAEKKVRENANVEKYDTILC